MKLRAWMMVGVGLLWVGAAMAQEAKTKAAAKADIASMTANELKWSEVPGTGGVMSAPLWGDMSKGAYGAMFKFPAGKAMPLHTHSSDYKLVVVSGTFLYGAGEEPQKKYGPGSFLTTGKDVKHTSGCEASGPCVFFMEQPGKFDMKPVGEKAPAKK